MRITKFGHACVRVEHDGVRLVIDPGVFTDAAAVEGADAILITHEHPDHCHPDNLRAAPGVPVHTIAAVAVQLQESAPDLADRVSQVAPGETLDLGLPVEVVGEKHAVIHDDYPRIDNSGYLITAGQESVYHPGDSLTPPSRPVDVLCAPISAPWLKIGEAVDFVREVAAPRAVGIHDEIYSQVALGMVDMHMGNLLPASIDFTRLAPGSDLA